MEFNSLKNKELIWNLCLENKLFNNLNNQYFKIAKSKFDELFNQIDKEQITITEKNKKIISIFSGYINDLKTKNNFNNLPKNNNLEILKPLEEVKITIDNNFKNKQEEFDNLININKPKEIEFNDKDEDSPFSQDELAKILEKTKKERDLITPDISNISNMTKKVQFEKDFDDNKSGSENSDSPGSLESLDLDKPAISFIDKLKKNKDYYSNSGNNNNLDEKLNIIIRNQEKIIKILESQSNFLPLQSPK